LARIAKKETGITPAPEQSLVLGRARHFHHVRNYGGS